MASSLTAPYPSIEYGGVSGPAAERVYAPIADNVLIWQGSIVQVDTAGRAVPGGAAATADTHLYRTIGRATQTYDNTVAGHAAGALTVEAQQGAFEFDNSSGDPLAQANAFSACYVETDHIIAATSNSNVLAKAGIFLGFSNDATGRPIVQMLIS